MEATRIRLAEGVHLTYLPARKFKTSLLSAQFVTPLRRETAGANALLAAVLRRGTVSCPDMGALSAKMDNLYDASIDYTVRKKGENQCVGFVASFIDDRYAPDGERLLEKKEAEDLYRMFGAALRDLPPKWRVLVLSSHTEFERCFGRPADKKRKLYNGMIKCDAFMYGR